MTHHVSAAAATAVLLAVCHCSCVPWFRNLLPTHSLWDTANLNIAIFHAAGLLLNNAARLAHNSHHSCRSLRGDAVHRPRKGSCARLQ